MEGIPEKFLPIGTVVLLKDATKRLMITGFCIVAEGETEGKIWDYCGCLYPQGVLESNRICLFDHEQIEKVFHLGLADDDEEREFKKDLNSIVNKE